MSERAASAVLFVCLGNICRSPLAEGVFLHLARGRGLSVRAESRGTGAWHVGEAPDPRTIRVAERHGVRLTSRGRVVDPARDFAAFERILPMDRSNRRALLALGAPAERVRLLRSFDPALAGANEHELEVPDPYTGGEEDFLLVYRMVAAACEGLLDEMQRGRS